MKFRSNCCCWLTLLLVGSSIISVSPNSSTTATTTFQKYHRQQSIYIQNTRSSTGLLPTTTNKFESLENYLFASTTMSPQAGLFLSQHQYQQQPQKQQQHEEQQKQLQQIPGSSMSSSSSSSSSSVQQMVTFITTPASPISTRISSSSSSGLLSSSSSSSSSSLSSSSSSSSMPAKTSASVDINSNSIRRKRRIPSSSRSVDDDDVDSSSYSSSVTGAMVHHHYPVQNPTESYPSMFFQMNASLKEHQQYRGQISSNNIKRSKRDDVMNDDTGMDKCHTFVVGEPEQSLLYSPDYPNDYPKNINCTRIIEAPKGQLIRLDFRNSFNIENKEDCKFDYLEIRDGPYGFSNLIGKYCGEDFPPMITSKERHLWLHFHSDESIEYSGFTAVYEFIDRPKEAISTELNCTLEKDGYEGFINSTDVPEYVQSNVTKYKIPLDCMWIIRVTEGWKIQVKFLQFSLNKPNDCEINFIDIFAKDTNIPSRVKNFCGSTGEPVASESNILHIRFYAEQIAINSSFSILYTAFRDKGTGCVAEEEYDCEDATCIAANLKCNGRANCKFRWDEEACENKEAQMSEHLQIIIVVFGLILGGMVATFVWNCVRKIMRDQKIIREVPAGIYHIDSYVRDAPKTAIFVGLQDDFFIDYPEILTPSSTCPTFSPSSSASSSSTPSQMPDDEQDHCLHHQHHYDEITNSNKNYNNKEYNNNIIDNLDNYSCNNNQQQDYHLDSPYLEDDHSVSF
ncbi:neuropilin and tolloid-like protein 1 isoform X2 [Eupeodes corollae]|uniref:neuropilin and tolloid-like protein 1 isoform X2 n=1 Tax=Eupeodes corollae TaxID=290404 RepID=UPI00249391D3|nr:neuropilin and tolloid-like protein 1 isoform X2 [Eupeodes corollae]